MMIIDYIWQALNTPALQLTTLQALAIAGAFLAIAGWAWVMVTIVGKAIKR